MLWLACLHGSLTLEAIDLQHIANMSQELQEAGSQSAGLASRCLDSCMNDSHIHMFVLTMRCVMPSWVLGTVLAFPAATTNATVAYEKLHNIHVGHFQTPGWSDAIWANATPSSWQPCHARQCCCTLSSNEV